MTAKNTEPAQPLAEVSSSEIVRCVEISQQLKANMDVMKRLSGDNWKERSKEYRIILLAVMTASGDTNPLNCALPMAQEMSERGHSPLMLLAVATEMSEAPNAQDELPKGARQ